MLFRKREEHAEKEVKECFSIDKNKSARDIALNFGPDINKILKSMRKIRCGVQILHICVSLTVDLDITVQL